MLLAQLIIPPSNMFQLRRFAPEMQFGLLARSVRDGAGVFVNERTRVSMSHAAPAMFSAKLRYCRTSQHQMMTLVETRNYPERQMPPPVFLCLDELLLDGLEVRNVQFFVVGFCMPIAIGHRPFMVSLLWR